MGVKPFYTSASLIEAVKRNQSVPISQITYEAEDILVFATEEIFLSQIPSILQYHEEYYVYEQDIPLVGGKSRYPIPARAIGMKLRDLYYVDTQGQLVEMSKINPDDESFFATDSQSNPTPIHYKIQNNSIVIVPSVAQTVQGKLRFTYFLRPNSLVTDDKAAISTSFSKAITFDNANLVAGDVITINGVDYVADTDFAIGANSSITASNFSSSLSTDYTFHVDGPICTVTFFDRNTAFSSSSAGAQVQSTIQVNCTSVPEEITEGSIVDILQTDGGHNTLNIDVRLASGSVSTTSITFKETDIPEEFVPGDYICLQYQCIIPQIPTDLHTLLAERTCARILESMGDREGLATANKKIDDLEARQSAIIDSRVEGSPTKVFNRHSLLMYGKARFGRGRR
jgi:hypothetical protein